MVGAERPYEHFSGDRGEARSHLVLRHAMSQWRRLSEKIIYDESVKPERLVYTHSSGKEDDSGRFQLTVTFAEQDGKPKLTIIRRGMKAKTGELT